MKLFTKPLLLALFVSVAFMAGVVYGQVGLQKAIATQEAHNPNFFQNNEVVATGVSLDDHGNAVIKVFTKNANAKGIPAFVNGVSVHTVVSGEIFAGDRKGDSQRGKPGGNGGTNPQDRHPRPVPIGVSTGTFRPGATNYCFAGTLGCRLQRIDVLNGNAVSYFMLSNNHVFADENNGVIGLDQILQPGTLDADCTYYPSDQIGTLADFVDLKFDGSVNYVDAAIGSTTTADCGFATPDDVYGAPSSTTLPAIVGMPVQKFGRTTAHTLGEVDAINATVNVSYDSGTARFENQIIIIGKTQRGKKWVDTSFSDGGDSGSLIVTQVDNDPVALLFAGNSTVTIGCPIDAVLDAFSDPGNGIVFTIDDGN